MIFVYTNYIFDVQGMQIGICPAKIDLKGHMSCFVIKAFPALMSTVHRTSAVHCKCY